MLKMCLGTCEGHQYPCLCLTVHNNSFNNSRVGKLLDGRYLECKLTYVCPPELLFPTTVIYVGESLHKWRTLIFFQKIEGKVF